MAISYDGGLTCSLAVSNLEESIAWYCDHLGFALEYRTEDIGWCELRSPVAGVNIGLSENDDAGGKGGATLTFGVTDIEAAQAELEDKAIRTDGPIQEIPGLVRLLTFYDPDDNAMMFYEVPKNA